MTEQKTKKRGWVKNAIIIFLAVMLVLTFFSNTFMNRSLPEVATQYTSSGPISAVIRGEGTASANETYEVKIEQTRKVLSTHVRVGDMVETGALLFKLQTSDSEELQALRETLEELEYNYQIALLDAGANDGSRSNVEIQRAREDLADAKAALELLKDVSLEEISSAKNRIAELNVQLNILGAQLKEAQNNLDAIGPLDNGSSSSASGQALTRAQRALEEAKTSYDAIYLRYGDAYGKLVEIARALYNAQTTKTYSEAAFLEALAADFSVTTLGASTVPGATDAYDDFVGDPLTPDYTKLVFPKSTGTEYGKKELADAYKAVTQAAAARTAAEQAYNEALNNYYEDNNPGNAYQYQLLKQKVDEAQAAYDKVNADKEHVEKLLAGYETQRADYAAAREKVRSLSDALEDLLLQQKVENVAQTKEAMALERQRLEIEETRAKIEGMESGSAQTEVTAAVSGMVRAVNVSSGNRAEADAVLATIEVVDRGYSMNMPVTNEQAERVRVGDSADVSSYNWGSKITATLTGIRNDPEKPGQGKLLMFSLSGDVESGAQLNVAIGERSRNYDVIVPNSAIREDSNGTFVYVVEARNSPLGNRYFATRVDVTILAKDDNNSAVSGALSGWNASVITTVANNDIVTAGTQVRLADNA